MKRILLLLAAVALVAAASLGYASGMAKGAKTGTWKGEVLDAGCYLSRAAMGESHKECALKCAANGMPLMLMTADGRPILLTPNHDDLDPYNSLKDMAGSVVVVTGVLSERGGIRGIDVTGAKLAAK